MTTRRVLALLLLLCVIRGAAALNATHDVLVTNATAMPTEVAVHVVERFAPYESKTFVGPYRSILVGSGYRLMTSFRAYEFNVANAVTMDCFSVSKDNGQWVPLPSGATGTDDEHKFCARRDLGNDSSHFAVAQFQRYSEGPVLIHFSQGNLSAVIADAKSRGWMEPPLVTIKVSQLKAWHTAPVLRLIAEIEVAAAMTKNETEGLCVPDANAIVERKVDGGDYYAGTNFQFRHYLCVTYVRRSLQDLDPKEEFATNVRFFDRSVWTWQACPLFESIGASYIGGYPLGGGYYNPGSTLGLFRATPEFEEIRLLCQDKRRLVRDDDNTKSVNDPSAYAQRVYFDETPKDRNERLKVEYHSKRAWVFNEQTIDADLADKF